MDTTVVLNKMEELQQRIQSNPEYAAEFQAMIEKFAAYFVVIAFAALILGIIMIVANWRIFRKAGTGGWKAIVPIYCDYTFFKIAWKPRYFWFEIILAVAASLLSVLEEYDPERALIFMIASAVVGILILVLEIKLHIKLAKAFRKGGGFAAGLIFLPFIFFPILGFGRAKYRRRKRRKQRALPQE